MSNLIERRNILEKRHAEKVAIKLINSFRYISFISLQDNNSNIIMEINKTSHTFLNYDYNPTYKKNIYSNVIETNYNNIIRIEACEWVKKKIVNSFSSQQWLICVDYTLNYSIIQPIWINIKVTNFEMAIEEMFMFNIWPEIKIYDKKSRKLFYITSSEYYYGIYISEIYK